MYQNQPGSKLKMRMLPSSFPGQRLPPWKWANSATLPSPSMGRRRPCRVARKASRPLASTRKRARISREPAALGDGGGHAVVVEGHPLDGGGLQQRHVRLPGRVIEQDLVELAPLDLVGVGGPRLALAEEELVAEIHVLVVEVGPVLHEEAARLHRVEHAEPLQHRHVGGQQRLAHVKARERLALGEGHPQPAAREEGRRARAARPAADHQHVVVGGPRGPGRTPRGRLERRGHRLLRIEVPHHRAEPVDAEGGQRAPAERQHEQ